MIDTANRGNRSAKVDDYMYVHDHLLEANVVLTLSKRKTSSQSNWNLIDALEM